MLESLTLQPVARFDGEINLPGSKSVSNRALLLAAMARGTTRLTNLLDSDDVRHMLNALKTLGVHFQLSDCRTICDVVGIDGPLKPTSPVEIFLGNAGTAMRPLAAALSLGGQRRDPHRRAENERASDWPSGRRPASGGEPKSTIWNRQTIRLCACGAASLAAKSRLTVRYPASF
ncbi:3-phosphoshikimate 1-carboxyvinyltransferase [Leminorella grimontii]|nr:3-phosphoshikimate 1-carboxyvinyltransferase [Leminorella grimontii]